MNNNTEQSVSHITQAVLAKITKGEVSMRARWQFVVRMVLLVVLIALTLVTSSFVVSFIIFSSKASGHLFLLGFGGAGLRTFFSLFPWTLFAMTVVLFVLVRMILKRFRWGYQHSFLTVFGVIAVTSIAVGTAVSATPLHPFLLQKADQDALPLLKGQYEALRTRQRERDHGVFQGTITTIAADSFTLFHNDVDADVDDRTVQVMVPPTVDLTAFQVGDTVFVAGDLDSSGVIRAYGIREIGAEGLLPSVLPQPAPAATSIQGM